MNWEDGLVSAVTEAQETISLEEVSRTFYDTVRRLAYVMHEGLDNGEHEIVESEALNTAKNILEFECGSVKFAGHYRDTFELEGAVYRTLTDLRRPRDKWTTAARVITAPPVINEGNLAEGLIYLLDYKQSHGSVNKEGNRVRITRAASNNGNIIGDDRVSEVRIDYDSLQRIGDSMMVADGIEMNVSFNFSNMPSYSKDFRKFELPIDLDEKIGEIDRSLALKKIEPILRNRETENTIEHIINSLGNRAIEELVGFGVNLK